EHADARAHLDDALNLLENCADIYNRCDDANRRLCNQAFFTKVYIDEDDNLRVENNRPFEMLLNSGVNANAPTGLRTPTRPEPPPKWHESGRSGKRRCAHPRQR